jgi:DNA-binding transcriptional regulator PaaX
MKRKPFNAMAHDSDPQKHRRGELAKEILLMIAAGVAIPAAFLMPNIPFAFKPLLKALTKKSLVGKNASLIRSITYLKRNRLVSVGHDGDQQILILSEKGRKKVLQFNADRMAIRKPRRWDGYWRIVLFDIPERRRPGREALRNKLKQLGFYQLQKSCFIHPFECKSEIDFVTELYEVSSYVNFVLAKEIEGQTLLQKMFGLV